MLKKLLFSAVFVGSLATAQSAQAQMGPLVNLVGAGLSLGTRAILVKKKTDQPATQQPTAEQATAERSAIAAAGPSALVVYRTPADKMPKQATQQLTDLEAQLDRCHAAMLADAKAAVCTPEQRAAIQQAALGVARAKPGFNLQPYQQEMAFYMAEDARRQQATAPVAPAN